MIRKCYPEHRKNIQQHLTKYKEQTKNIQEITRNRLNFSKNLEGSNLGFLGTVSEAFLTVGLTLKNVLHIPHTNRKMFGDGAF